MGLFHCPIGALGCGKEGCIRCGLCNAVTREEKIQASNIMRRWIQENAFLRNRDFKIRKIAVCGKGGSGKSTTTALLSGALEQLGYASLVIDTDSSNGGLWKKLGMVSSPQALNSNDRGVAVPEFLKKDPLYFSDLAEPYAQEKGLRKIICAGKIEDPLLGCACEIGEYAKTLLQNLTTREKEIVIADQEAGVESFGRGIEQFCDTVLIIVEPSLESIDLAAKIQYMAQGLGISRIRAILNKVEDEEQDEFIRERLSEREIRFLGAVPLQRDLRKKNLYGQEIPPEEAYALFGQTVMYMLDEAEMRYQQRRLI